MWREEKKKGKMREEKKKNRKERTVFDLQEELKDPKNCVIDFRDSNSSEITP